MDQFQVIAPTLNPWNLNLTLSTGYRKRVSNFLTLLKSMNFRKKVLNRQCQKLDALFLPNSQCLEFDWKTTTIAKGAAKIILYSEYSVDWDYFVEHR